MSKGVIGAAVVCVIAIVLVAIGMHTRQQDEEIVKQASAVAKRAESENAKAPNAVIHFK